MKRATSRLLAALLAVALCLTGCGKKPVAESENTTPEIIDTHGIPLTSFEDIGEYELSAPACYQDGIIRLYYDGNLFIPAKLEAPNESFFELTFLQADLRNTDKQCAYGYIYYSIGQFESSLEDIIANEEIYSFGGQEQAELVKEEYGTKSENYLGYTYDYMLDGVETHAILIAQNVPGDMGGSYVAMFESDIPGAIESARATLETIEFVGQELNETEMNESFDRTDKIHNLLCPPVDPGQRETSDGFDSGLSIDSMMDKESVSKIYFEDSMIDLTVGDTYQMEVGGESAGNKTEFVSTNEDCATISQTGLVTAVQEGFATVVVSTDDGQVATAYVNVAAAQEADEIE